MRDDGMRRPEDLRSARWFAPDDLRSFGHRSRMMQLGYGEEDFMGRPVIGVLNTWSEINSCHGHFRERAADVKRGVAQAGGLALEMPALSVDESFTKPTSMLYRNMLAMEVEEMIRSHPFDAVVAMGGCDKTTPGLVMGAISAGIPFIYLPAGPMLRGHHAGRVLGSGSDAWRYWDERRAGHVTDEEWRGLQGGIARSVGTCMTMGTASTMTAIVDAMGLSAARRLLDPGGGLRPPAHVCGLRAAHRGHGVGGPDPRPDRHARRGEERGRGGDGHGLLDQRRDPPRSPWRGARACRSRSTTSTRWGARRRSWPTSGRRGRSI